MLTARPTALLFCSKPSLSVLTASSSAIIHASISGQESLPNINPLPHPRSMFFTIFVPCPSNCYAPTPMPTNFPIHALPPAAWPNATPSPLSKPLLALELASLFFISALRGPTTGPTRSNPSPPRARWAPVITCAKKSPRSNRGKKPFTKVGPAWKRSFFV